MALQHSHLFFQMTLDKEVKGLTRECFYCWLPVPVNVNALPFCCMFKYSFIAVDLVFQKSLECRVTRVQMIWNLLPLSVLWQFIFVMQICQVSLPLIKHQLYRIFFVFISNLFRSIVLQLHVLWYSVLRDVMGYLNGNGSLSSCWHVVHHLTSILQS